MATNSSATVNRILGILIVLASIAIVVVGGIIVRSVFMSAEAPRTALERDMEAAKAAVKAKPRDAGAHTDLGGVYFRMGDYDDAEIEFKRALSLNKLYLIAQFNLAMVYKAKGETDLAVKELNALLKKYPGDDTALYRLGEIYLEQKQYNKAIGAFRRSVEFNPIVADTHYKLGLAYEKTGKKALAVKQYRQVLRYIPDHAEARSAVRRLTAKKKRKQ